MTDLAGNNANYQLSIERRETLGSPDPVLGWNQAALEAIRQDARTPLRLPAARLSCTPGYAVSLAAPAGTSG